MIKNQNLKIYKASAGSGKTYTIVKKYLSLALDSPNFYKQILAVTFTNKVANELKHRVLETVEVISKGEINSIAREILEEKSWTKEQITENAKKLLTTILQDYSAFQVCTIDSFFQKVIEHFDIELNLKPGFTIELDTSDTKKAVLVNILNKVKTNKFFRNWLLQLAYDKLKDGKNWEIEKDLLTISSALLAENKFLIEQSLEAKFIVEFIKILNQEILNFEKKLQCLGKKAMETIKFQNLKVEDFAYGKSGIMGYLEKVSVSQIEKPTVRVIKALESSENWISKKVENRVDIQVLVERSLLPLLQEFLLYYKNRFTIYSTAKVAKRFIYLLGIKSEIQYEILRYKSKCNILFISDATMLTYKKVKNCKEKNFLKKFDYSYKNFFIDEFQDISTLQWECFKPLIKKTVADKNCSMIVGDVKQSIYRWRNGDWNLLHKDVAIDIPDNETIFLNTNWRSLRNIVLFNNTFFSISASLIREHLQKSFLEIEDMHLRNTLSIELENLCKTYDSVVQCNPDLTSKKNGGYVELKFLENNKELNFSWQDEAIDQTLSKIESLQVDGFEAKEIAILVRNHKEGSKIFDAILQRSTSAQKKENCNYTVVSTSSASLGKNSYINLLVSSMRYIYNPENSLIRYEIFYFFKICSSKTFEIFNFDTQDLGLNCRDDIIIEDEFEKNFLTKIESLHSYPLHTLVDALQKIFELENSFYLPFYQKLKDLLIDFEKKRGGLKNFLLWWEEKGRHTSLPEQNNINAIKILTIHQAKGLQFKAVLLPFCDWDFDHNTMHAPLLWCKAESVQKSDIFAKSPLLPVFYSPKLRETFFARSFYNEQMQSFLDNMNLLYVAMTRAEECMYIFSQKSTNTIIKTIADLMYAAISQKSDEDKKFVLGNWNQFWNEEKGLFQIGERVICEKKNVRFENFLQIKKSTQVINDWTPIFDQIEKKVNSEEILLGDIIHNILSEIRSLKDLTKILKKIDYLQIIEEGKLCVKNIFLNFSKNLEISLWFDGSWTHKIECTIIAEDGTILRPDRVLIRGEKIIVLDFKTGLESSTHSQQVKKYITALASIYSSDIEGWVVYLSKESIRNSKII